MEKIVRNLSFTQSVMQLVIIKRKICADDQGLFSSVD